MENNKELAELLIKEGYLKTPQIVEAFLNIDRKDFVLEEFKDEAYENYPLSIGYGQTISQPATVAFMLELLRPAPGQKILDIGSGSGWQSALLAYIITHAEKKSSKVISCQGQIFAIERIPELVEFGKKNVSKYNFVKKGVVKFICGDGSKGLPEEAPFDRIIVAAEAEEIPGALREQLKEDGRMVLPVQQSIYLVTKNTEQEFPGFVFVPLIRD
jgi:protein-L-isoaspartate(D-aspartate) O-methyltransferase